MIAHSKLALVQEAALKHGKVKIEPADLASLLSDMCNEMKTVEGQIRGVEGQLRAYKGMALEELNGEELGAAMVDVKVKMILAYDLVWRIGRRLGKDAAEIKDLIRAAGTHVEAPRRQRSFRDPLESPWPRRTPRKFSTRRETEDPQNQRPRDIFSESEILDFVMTGAPLRGRYKEERR
ncbi:hypothetical protein BDV93DRAFT_27741 [Ceratobasidium sp. AG-I]|nr:hypothetical protein BDV93DRAFT_27741 [Ceratobasidium sp. AG-I]